MSFTSNHSTEHNRPSKRRIQRRHGACEPCRASKTKCDGRQPCGACRSEKRKQCPCTYSEKVMKLQQVTAEIRRRTEQERAGPDPLVQHVSPSGGDPYHGDGTCPTTPSNQERPRPGGVKAGQSQSVYTREEHSDIGTTTSFTPLSLCGAVNEYKSMKSAKGSASQVIARCDGLEALDPSTNIQPADSKRNGMSDAKPGSAKSENMDETLFLKDRLDAVWGLVTQGRLKRAWIDLASLVREAELVETSVLTKKMSSEDRLAWKKLWTNILDLESQLGLALGRPTSLVLPKEDANELNMDISVLHDDDLNATRLELYQHIQSVLSLDPRSSSLSSDFYDKASAVFSFEPFHKVSLCTTEDHSASARDLQLNIHLLFMILYCRLASLSDIHARDGKPPISLISEPSDASKPLSLNQPRQKLMYCRMMLKSAKFVVSVFLSLISDDSDNDGPNWMRCHAAFIAATLLGIAKLRHEVEWDPTTELLRKLEQAFAGLSQCNPNYDLFKVAIDRLQDLNSVREPISDVVRNKHSGIKHRKRHATNSAETSPARPNVRDQAVFRDYGEPAHAPARFRKRRRDQMDEQSRFNLNLVTSFSSTIDEPEVGPPMSAASTSFEVPIDPAGYYQDSSAYSQNSSFLSSISSSTATSFCESEAGLAAMHDSTILHPGPPFVYPFPSEIVHPPMMLYNPTMLTAGQVLNSAPMGVQYFQTNSSIEGNHTMLGHLSPVAPVQGIDVSSQGNRITSNAITASQMFQLAHGQVQLADPGLTPKSSQLVSPPQMLRMEQNLPPAISQGPSVDSLKSTFGHETSPLLHQWHPQSSAITTGEATQDGHRASSEDTTDHVQEHQQQAPRGSTFFVPMTRPLSVPLDNASVATYQHAPVRTAAHGSQYFEPSMTTATDLGHLQQNYSYSCHRQQDYLQGQEQWRQMSVNTEVSGGP